MGRAFSQKTHVVLEMLLHSKSDLAAIVKENCYDTDQCKDPTSRP